MDVIVVDEEHRRPIQRPSLTVVVDVCSRMVLGFAIYLEKPSAFTAGWWQAPRFVTTGRRRCQTETIEMYGSRPTLIFAVVFVCQERARALSGFVSPGGSCVRQTVIRGSLGTLVL